jgi:hypothetical protein
MLDLGVNRRAPCADNTPARWISDPFYVQAQSTASPLDLGENQVQKIHFVIFADSKVPCDKDVSAIPADCGANA